MVQARKLIRNAAIGALIGSAFNRPGTGAAVGALTAFGGGASKTLTYYYADWCPYCRNFKDRWDELKKMMRAKGWKTEDWNVETRGTPQMSGAVVQSLPSVSFIGHDGVPVVIKVSQMSAPEISATVSKISGGAVEVEGGAKKRHRSPRRSQKGLLATALAIPGEIVNAAANMLGAKKTRRVRGGEIEGGEAPVAGGDESKWSLWGGEAKVEGGEVEGGRKHRKSRSPRRRMRGGDATPVAGGDAAPAPAEAPIAGGDVEGGKKHRRRMYGGETPAAVEGGEVEGGKKHRRRMYGGETPAVEGGAAPAAVEGGEVEGGKRRRMRGGETPAVEGGAAPAAVEGGEVEGGKKHKRRYMRGGETAPIAGGDAAPAPAEAPIAGGEVEGGKKHKRRHMRGGETVAAPAVIAGGDAAAPIAGGEIEGGRRKGSLPMKLRRWNEAKRSVERRLGRGLGVVHKGTKIYEEIKRKSMSM